MGLGKTVEVLALILGNPWKNISRFVSSEKEIKIPTRATLIVVPGTLASQWLREIQTRVDSGKLSVLNTAYQKFKFRVDVRDVRKCMDTVNAEAAIGTGYAITQYRKEKEFDAIHARVPGRFIEVEDDEFEEDDWGGCVTAHRGQIVQIRIPWGVAGRVYKAEIEKVHYGKVHYGYMPHAVAYDVTLLLEEVSGFLFVTILLLIFSFDTLFSVEAYPNPIDRSAPYQFNANTGG